MNGIAAEGLPKKRVSAPDETDTHHSRHADVSEFTAGEDSDVLSAQAVSWWSVHEFVQRYLDTAARYPMCGTPAWCLLPDDSREKWAALLDFAQHHALRVECAQEARAQASHAVSGAAKWSQVGREIQQRSNFRTERPWTRREVRP